MAVTETFAVALSGEPKGWLVEAASADEALDIVHGTVPRAARGGPRGAARLDRALLPRPVSPRRRDAGELDATVTSRKCYGCAGTGRRGVFECGVCGGTGKLTGPYVQAHADSFRRGSRCAFRIRPSAPPALEVRADHPDRAPPAGI